MAPLFGALNAAHVPCPDPHEPRRRPRVLEPDEHMATSSTDATALRIFPECAGRSSCSYFLALASSRYASIAAPALVAEFLRASRNPASTSLIVSAFWQSRAP